MSIDTLLENVSLPQVMAVRQRYPRPQVADIEAEITRQLEEKGSLASLKPGQTVAITAGSRGITNLPLAIRAVVRAVKATGAEPFVIPAMGSHGGATAQGQVALLKGLGVDEDTVEAPIRATMDTVILGYTENGLPANLDANANAADAIIVINKIKPHPAFRGPIESGLMKMITIGLGKQKGAEICHKLGPGHLATNVTAIARFVLSKKISWLVSAFWKTPITRPGGSKW